MQVSIWHLLVLLLALTPWGWLIYLAVSRAYAERRSGTGVTPGFKGWLLILAAGLWLGVLRSCADFIRLIGERDAQISAQFPALILLDAITASVSIALVLASAWLLSIRSRAFRRTFATYFAWVIFGPAVSVILAVVVLQMIYGAEVSLSDVFGSMSATEIGQWLGGAVTGGLWLIYVQRSRRIAVTCVR